MCRHIRLQRDSIADVNGVGVVFRQAVPALGQQVHRRLHKQKGATMLPTDLFGHWGYGIYSQGKASFRALSSPM